MRRDVRPGQCVAAARLQPRSAACLAAGLPRGTRGWATRRRVRWRHRAWACCRSWGSCRRCCARCGPCCIAPRWAWACGCCGRGGSPPGWRTWAAAPAASRRSRRVPGVAAHAGAGARRGVPGRLWVAWPCGLLQSALVVAALANTAWGGAAVMAGFAAASAAGLSLAPWAFARLAGGGARRAAGQCLGGAPGRRGAWLRPRPGRWAMT